MLPTSGTFNFQSKPVEIIIREAFENIGILGEFVESQKLESAKRSIDLILLEWMSKSVNLWTLKSSYLHLTTGQAEYTLPNIVNQLIQANIRTTTRQLSGTPAASSGVAANAFDGNPLTACIQNAVNGNISYDYGAGITQQINFIGIQSNVTRSYTLVIETSVDNINWTELYIIPVQDYIIGVTSWFDVPTPINARAYRIREAGGSTLNIRELYFNNNIVDTPISSVSRYEYYTYPVKQLQGRPSVYYFNRQIVPLLYLWSTPSNMYNCLQYTYSQMIEDAGFYANALQVPSRLCPALVFGLSYRLALKFNPQVAGGFQAEYEKAFNAATIDDTEHTPISISIDWSY